MAKKIKPNLDEIIQATRMAERALRMIGTSGDLKAPLVQANPAAFALAITHLQMLANDAKDAMGDAIRQLEVLRESRA